jgi:hypothetical protein
VSELVFYLEPFEIGNPERGRGDSLPEFSQSFDALFRRIAGDQGRVDGADRNAGNPVRMQISLSQRLVHAGLI